MLTGVDFRQAIKYWTQGREVIVLDRTVKSPAGGYETYSFDELFRNLEFLVDVPAVEDPEFRQAVEDMVQESDLENEEDTETPPPHEAGEERRSGRKAKKGTSHGTGC